MLSLGMHRLGIGLGTIVIFRTTLEETIRLFTQLPRVVEFLVIRASYPQAIVCRLLAIWYKNTVAHVGNVRYLTEGGYWLTLSTIEEVIYALIQDLIMAEDLER